MGKDLPEEVMIDILSRLPVKSVTRFKCVSKPWLELLSNDPRFLKLHFNRSIQTTYNSNPAIIVSRLQREIPKMQVYYAEDYTECGKAPWFEIPSFSNSYFTVVNPCNGLLCLKSGFSFCVWNPLTGDHVIIPDLPIPSHIWEHMTSDDDFMYGFGYSQVSDEYKVITLLSAHISVYTLGTGSWRTLPGTKYTSDFRISSSTLLNGSLHLFATNLDHPTNSHSHETLIAFNMEDEVFEEIPQPQAITNYGYPYEVIVAQLGGLLCISSQLLEKYVELWVMNEYGVADSWTKKYRIEQPENWPHTYFKPLGLSINGEIIMITNRKDSRELILYDSSRGSIEILQDFGFHGRQIHDAFSFKESLLSPSIINGDRQ